jgi:hypothetical protein
MNKFNNNCFFYYNSKLKHDKILRKSQCFLGKMINVKGALTHYLQNTPVDVPNHGIIDCGP